MYATFMLYVMSFSCLSRTLWTTVCEANLERKQFVYVWYLLKIFVYFCTVSQINSHLHCEGCTIKVSGECIVMDLKLVRTFLIHGLLCVVFTILNEESSCSSCQTSMVLF